MRVSQPAVTGTEYVGAVSDDVRIEPGQRWIGEVDVPDIEILQEAGTGAGVIQTTYLWTEGRHTRQLPAVICRRRRINCPRLVRLGCTQRRGVGRGAVRRRDCRITAAAAAAITESDYRVGSRRRLGDGDADRRVRGGQVSVVRATRSERHGVLPSPMAGAPTSARRRR